MAPAYPRELPRCTHPTVPEDMEKFYHLRDQIHILYYLGQDLLFLVLLHGINFPTKFDIVNILVASELGLKHILCVYRATSNLYLLCSPTCYNQSFCLCSVFVHGAPGIYLMMMMP